MNSVTAPSRACASATNFATSAVRSVKPAPEVCTVSSEDTMVLALTAEGVVRERDLRAVIKGTPSNPAAVDVPLHPVGHFDQAPPGPLQERHHAIHVAVARQRDFDLALAFRHLRLALLQ